MKYLNWLLGTSIVAGVLALISDQILKVASNEIEILANKGVRGGVFGAVAGLAMGVFGTPAAKRSVSGWRGKLSSLVGKEK